MAAIPREFSKTKENRKAPEIIEEEQADDTDVILKAIQCKENFPEWTGGEIPLKHTVDMAELVKYEFGVSFMDMYTFQKHGLDDNGARVLEGKGRNDPTPLPRPHFLLLPWSSLGRTLGLLWGAVVMCFIAFLVQHTDGDTDTDYSNLILGIVLLVWTCIESAIGTTCIAIGDDGDIREMLPAQCTVVRNGRDIAINASDLVVGDVLHLEMGMKVPADVRLFECRNLKIEQSSLTGEPDAIRKNENRVHENPLEAQNLAFFGTAVVEGRGKGFVISVGDLTVMACMHRLGSDSAHGRSGINLEIRRVVTFATIVALVFAGICFIVALIFNVQLVVVIIGILLLILQLLFVCILGWAKIEAAVALANQGIQIKRLEVLETLTSITCIIGSKTGTLTENKMTATHIYLELEDVPADSKHVYDVLGLTAATSYDTLPPTNLKDPAYLCLMWCCNLGNKSVFHRTEENMGRPIQARDLVGGNASDFAFTRFAEGWCHRKKSPGQIDYYMAEQPLCEKMRDECPAATGPVGGGKTQPIIIPFNSSWKFMVSVNLVVDYEGRYRYAVFMKGAAERVFQRCGRYVKGSQFLPIDNKKAAHFIQTYNDFGKGGERVIGFAMKFLDEMPGYAFDARKGEHSINGQPFDLSGNPDDCNYAIGTEQYEMIQQMYDGSVMNVTEDGPTYPAPTRFAMDFVGIISLIDPPRDTVLDAVQRCQKWGVKVALVTGDHPLTAAATARMMNIIQATADTVDSYAEKHGITKDEAIAENQIKPGTPFYDEVMTKDEYRHLRGTLSKIEARVVPGHELAKLTEKQLQMALLYRDVVFARVSPEQQYKIVRAAQNLGHCVAFTGSGVSDAPALKAADIGCAMGIAGTDTAKKAADVILTTDDFAGICAGIRKGMEYHAMLKGIFHHNFRLRSPYFSSPAFEYRAGVGRPSSGTENKKQLLENLQAEGYDRNAVLKAMMECGGDPAQTKALLQNKAEPGQLNPFGGKVNEVLDGLDAAEPGTIPEDEIQVSCFFTAEHLKDTAKKIFIVEYDVKERCREMCS